MITSPNRPSDELREYIESRMHLLQPGDAFPLESDLAQEFKVSERTVRRALASYRKDGRLAFIPGKGSFIPLPIRAPVQIQPSQEPSFLSLFRMLQSAISKGEFKRGDPLPFAKFLCYQYKVAPVSVQKAFRMLEEKGLAVRGGKRYWVGHTPQLGVTNKLKEIFFFNLIHSDAATLFANDLTGPSYSKMEVELQAQGYKVVWETLEHFSRLKKQWQKSRHWPHGIVFSNAASTSIIESIFRMVRDIRNNLNDDGPRILVIGNHPQRPIRGFDWFCPGHIVTSFSRLLARHLFEKHIKKAALFFDENIFPAREIITFSRMWTEAVELDPNFRFRVVVNPKTKGTAPQDMWNLLSQQIPASHLENLLSKYRKTPEKAMTDSLCMVGQFEDAYREHLDCGLWFFPRASEALHALHWCRRHRIKVPEQISIVTHENHPSILEAGISLCGPNFDGMGYLLAHALIGDIVLEKTSKGFVQAQSLFLHRLTTRT